MIERRSILTLAALLAYIGSILLANWLTSAYGQWPVWWGLEATAGTYAAGFALLARDAVQRSTGTRTPEQRRQGITLALVAMLAGVALSWALADPRVALASAVAFGSAELVDLLVYTPVARVGWGRAVLASNVVSAPVDTVVFLAIAGFPITWASISGQLVGKLLWATLLPLAVYAATRWLLARRRATVAA